MAHKELTQLLRELIQFRTTTMENTNRCLVYIFEWLMRHGLSPLMLENNHKKIVVLRVGEGPRVFVINGHVDVVQGHDEQFVPVMHGDRMYGRGAYDMLGSIAAMMILARKLNNEKIPVQVMFQFCPDEESGGHDGTAFLAENGFLGEFVICCEPTNFHIALQAKGVIQLQIDVTGVAAHGSRPWLGNNAITKAFHIYENIEKAQFTKIKTTYFPKYSVNLAKIEGGVVINSVPDFCRIFVEIRYMPDQLPEDILHEINSIIGDSSCQILNLYPPVVTREDHACILQLQRSIRLHLKVEPTLFGQDGTADTRFFAAKGIPAIEFGPAGSGHHGPEEYVTIPSLEVFIEILHDFIIHS